MEGVMTPTVAYLAEGKLYTKRGDAAPRLIDSPFVQSMLNRIQRSRERHDWKSQGMAWQMGAGGFGGLMGGRAMAPAETRRVRFSGLTRGQNPGELLYALDTDHVGGLFLYDTAQQSERRLYHRNQFRAANLSRHPINDTLAVSLRAEDGSAHIAIMEQDGRGLKEITEGDVIDEAPAWSPGDGKTIVYQSSGIGRNAAGFMVAQGPYAIQKLDLDSGDLTTLIEEDTNDLLLPRLLPDGSVLFIRRPYEPSGFTVSPLKVAKDIVFFPFRLVVAIVHFFNWFSHVFARKPLITAGGPTKEGPEQRYIMLWGKMIDAEKAMAQKKGGDAKSLVPPTWQLVKRAGDDTEEVLAKGVLSFDLADDGSIVYTNGSAVYHRAPDGVITELCRGKMIEHVSVVT
jgi:hypothetical protein